MEQLEKFSSCKRLLPATDRNFLWLDEYLESTERSLGAMDLSTLQPTSWRHFQPLIAEEWIPWFEKIIQARKTQQVSFEKVARILPPDLCREHLLFTLEDLKTARIPREKRLEFAGFFYQTLKAQMQEDLFGLDGSNRKRMDANEIMQKTFQQGTPDAAKVLGRMYNAAYNLGTALYLDFYMGKAIENYGPYQLGENRILVIKIMRHLHPREIWPEIQAGANQLVWYAVYENVSFATDLIACHTYYQGNLIIGLKKWRLEKDGNEVTDLKEIEALTQNIAEEGKKRWMHLLALPESELLEKAVWIRCYVFKELCELLGLDWHPTPKLSNAVKGKTLKEGFSIWNPPKDSEKAKEYWRKIWDPRADFYPC